jgi:DNA polymerase-3 subunit delta
MHAFDFLDQPPTAPLAGLWVIHGDDRWLRKTTEQAFHRLVLGGDDAVGPVRFDDPTCDWSDVARQLTSVSLFGPPISYVVVDDADKFVSAHRGELEAWAVRRPTGAVLLLGVSSWPGNTRLAKLLATQGQAIDSNLPSTGAGFGKTTDTKRVGAWLQSRAKSAHQFTLSREAAENLLSRSEHELGLLDQHLAKLALYAISGRKVDVNLVEEVIGGWRQRDSFVMLQLALDGRGLEAVEQLDRLLQGSEVPQMMFGALAHILRKYAQAVRILEQQERRTGRRDMKQALAQAGFYPSELEVAQRRLRHLGRERSRQLYARLLEMDLALKGSHSTPDRSRWLFERLLIELAQPAPAPRVGV